MSTLHPASLGRHLHPQAPVLRILRSRYIHSNYHVSVLTNSSVNLVPIASLCFVTVSHSDGCHLHLHTQAAVLRILWRRYIHSNYHVSVLTNSSVNLVPIASLCFVTVSHSDGCHLHLHTQAAVLRILWRRYIHSNYHVSVLTNSSVNLVPIASLCFVTVSHSDGCHLHLHTQAAVLRILRSRYIHSNYHVSVLTNSSVNLVPIASLCFVTVSHSDGCHLHLHTQAAVLRILRSRYIHSNYHVSVLTNSSVNLVPIASLCFVTVSHSDGCHLHLHTQAAVLRILWRRYIHSNYHVSVLTNSSVNLVPIASLCFVTVSHSDGCHLHLHTQAAVLRILWRRYIDNVMYPYILINCLPIKARIANVTHSYGWHLRTDRGALVFDAGYR